MMMKKNIIISAAALLCALALAGCSGKMEQPGAELCFDAVVEDELPLSKAAGEITDITSKSLGVFACNTGRYRYADSNANPDFMYNEQVYHDGSRWTYDIPKYWPEGYVSFFAYAPYSDGTAGCISSFSDQDEKGNPWLTYQLSAKVGDQVDLLYAEALTDWTRPSTPTPLTFSFKHALACVGERVSVACSDALKKALTYEVTSTAVDRIRVLVNSVGVTYHLTAKARLVLWNSGDANWQPILSGDVMTDRTVDYLSGGSGVAYDTSDTSDTAVTGWTSEGEKGVFYIPLDVAGNTQSADISVEYTIERTTGAVVSTSTVSVGSSLQLRSNAEAFAPGKKMDLKVQLIRSTP